MQWVPASFFKFFRLSKASVLSRQLVREFSLAFLVLCLCALALSIIANLGAAGEQVIEQQKRYARLSEHTTRLRVVSSELQYWQLRLIESYAKLDASELGSGIGKNSPELAEYQYRKQEISTLMARLSAEKLSEPANQARARLDSSIATLERQEERLNEALVNSRKLSGSVTSVSQVLASTSYLSTQSSAMSVKQSALELDEKINAESLRGLELATQEATKSWRSTQYMIIGAMLFTVLMLWFLLRALRQIAKLIHTLKESAGKDPLTGLMNRRALEQHIELGFANALRNDAPVSMVVLDLDFFKQYNDQHGHVAGDELLMLCADIWQHQVRATDMVVRMGGEEFAVLMSGCTAAQALDKSNQLQNHMPKGVTFSAGVAQWQPSEPFIQLYQRCDQAMYRAKSQGRNRCLLAQDTVDERIPAARGALPVR